MKGKKPEKRYITTKLLIILTLLASVATFYLLGTVKSKDKRLTATDTNKALTTQVDWQAGTRVNIDDTSSEGSVKMSLTPSELDLLDIYNEDPDSVTAEINSEMRANLVDSDLETLWGSSGGVDDFWHYDWTIDLGSLYTLTKIRQYREYYGGLSEFVETSEDGINFTSYMLWEGIEGDPGVKWEEIDLPDSTEGRYVRARVHNHLKTNPSWINELEVYAVPPDATHTTASTQIDGQEGSGDKTLIEWTSFTPTQTVPENTTLTYQFRTSDNASDWTEWTGDYTYSGTPIDLTGLSDDRYLQVKATLSNTDGVSTPQIDDYTINFHNNQKPNQPVAQTAIIE